MTQALGNCNQPLTHRAAVNFAPPEPRQSGPGYVAGQQWNPADYSAILPTSDAANNVDVPGWQPPGGWGGSNYYGDTFNFPLNQQFTLNSYYGGPNVYNAGSQYVTNAYTNTTNAQTINATNVNVVNFNGEPVAGPAGPAGQPGQQGQPGAPGLIGVFVFNNRLALRVQRRVIGPYRARTRVLRIPRAAHVDPVTCDVVFDKFRSVRVVSDVRFGGRNGAAERLVDDVRVADI